MGEMIPIVLGALAGLAALFLNARYRAIGFAVLCALAGLIASYVNGELAVWWGFFSFDTLLAFLSGLVVYFGAGYLRRLQRQ